MIKKLIYIFYKKFKKFIRDEFGGNMVEYVLLIGFALFVFFILVGVITSILNWTLGLSNNFFDIVGGMGG